MRSISVVFLFLMISTLVVGGQGKEKPEDNETGKDENESVHYSLQPTYPLNLGAVKPYGRRNSTGSKDIVMDSLKRNENVEIPNAFKKMDIAENHGRVIDMPTRKLDGDNCAMMPGTDNLDSVKNKKMIYINR